MSLDITFTRRKKIVCPKCGEVVGHNDLDTVDSGGRLWFPFLEQIGYYVPYDKRTEENDWYGKDMVLTAEQAKYAYTFVQEEDVYYGIEIATLIAVAQLEKDDIVVNADW